MGIVIICIVILRYSFIYKEITPMLRSVLAIYDFVGEYHEDSARGKVIAK
jgi:hypothetical protein